MSELDQLFSALFLLSLLLYLVPAALGVGLSEKGRRWFQIGAALTLGIALIAAVAASVKSLIR